MVYIEPNNITGIYGIFEYANTVSGGSFFIMIPVSLFAIIFLYLKSDQYSTPDCLMAAGFITTIISVLLRLAEALTTLNLLWVVLITVGAALWGYYTRRA